MFRSRLTEIGRAKPPPGLLGTIPLRSSHTLPRVRADALALREPVSLQDALAAVGFAPHVSRKAGTRPHGLLRRWFAFEAAWLAALNALASLLLLAAATTLTPLGLLIALRIGFAPTVYGVLNDGLPWAAAALFAAAVFKAGQAYFDRKAPGATRIAGYSAAAVLACAGLWIAIMLGYADFVPWLLRPLLWLAGDAAAARIEAANTAAVSYFEPALLGAGAVVLSARQIRTYVLTRTPLPRKQIAFGGALLALAAATLGAAAVYRHHNGVDARDGFAFAIGGDTLSGRQSAYGALFAAGVPCHVTSPFGWRPDPVDPGQTKLHQGVDLAVKAGTPVHAMADGRILFAAYNAGLGNFVALRTSGPTILNGHMQSLAVSPGEAVHKGDVIGLAGSTGKATGPHVHLQLCPAGRMSGSRFVCGAATDPYQNWPALSALAEMSCTGGPQRF